MDTELLKRIESLEKSNAKQNEAIFGDGNGSLGMKKQLEDMYSIFVPVTLTGRFIIKSIMILGAIATAITAVFETLRFFKHTTK